MCQRVLGHIGTEHLSSTSKTMYDSRPIDLLELKDHQCIPFIESSTKRTPLPGPKPIQTELLELIHTDVSGKIIIGPPIGAHYFVVFLDNYTSMSFVDFLKYIPDVLAAMNKYKALD